MNTYHHTRINHTIRLYTAVSAVGVITLTIALSVLFPFKHNVLIFYLLAINVTAFIFYGLDKNLAQMGATRIPEKLLLGIGIIGGSAGSLLGINYLRHKNRKTSYLLKLGIILTMHIAFVTFLMHYLK